MTLHRVRIADRAVRLAWVPPAAGTALLTTALAWFAVRSAHHPAWVRRGHQWWQVALRPDARWTLPAWLGALALYWWPRRRHSSNVAIIALLTVVIGGVALGEASFWPCARGQAPVIAPLSWVLILFTGSLEPQVGPGTGCPGQLPLAL